MRRSIRLGFLLLLTLASGCVGPRPMARPEVAAPAFPAAVLALAQVAPGLDPGVLALALDAARCAARQGLVATADRLTVIDYSLPSNEPRLWVLDVGGRRLLHRELVAHGRGSGELHAIQFSNEPGSYQSSLGLFVTADAYEGKHGRSLRLHGLEPGINDRAFERAVVMHGADYVTDAFAAEHGRLGRSHGCPAVPLAAASAVIDTVQGGTPIFAYAADPRWRAASRLLGACDQPVAEPPPGATARGPLTLTRARQ